MSEVDEGWRRVIKAFEDWIYYESSEYGPYTSYFSLESLRDLTHKERIGWMRSMYEEIIPGRVDMCRQVKVSFEDFLPYMPDSNAIETVQSMIDLAQVIEDSILGMSDSMHEMKEEYEDGSMDEIVPHLTTLAEAEEDIRHHMSLFSKGFAKLKSMGLEMPDLE
ncbi:MAG: hypothetical protein ACTSV3_03595 [Candidatus Thorarchaeota archaeon]|nr:MAG: hypothetical protein DRP09_03575 [Candidatus Thorarchaeota archaeon]RLI59354.1 MAG: hypothetical protein DRO87_03125 [Candidatus Thorarchaeota archaeon]